MKEQFFEKEFKNYNDIKIPDSLDFKVRQSLKLAKNKKRKSNLLGKEKRWKEGVKKILVLMIEI